MGKVIGVLAKLRGNKLADLQWDGFTSGQQPTRIPKCAKLQRKAEPVPGMTSGANMLNVVVGQCVVVEYHGLVGGKIKKCGLLSLC